MENLLHEINKAPISYEELANILDAFLVDNHDVYRQNLYDIQNCPWEFSHLFTDNLIVHMMYFVDKIISLFFAFNDRMVYTNFHIDELTFFSMNSEESFDNIINTLKNRHSTTSGYFMHNNDLYEFVENVDIYWITKRSNVKSSAN